MTIEAMKAIQLVYANTTKHDWPDDIWDAICQAIEAAVEEQHKPSQSDIKHEQGEPVAEKICGICGYVGVKTDSVGQCPKCHWDELVTIDDDSLRSALNAMLTQFGMDEDEWNNPTFDKARKALATPQPKREPLTDEQRNWIVATCPTPRHIIDAVERMHGIKGAS